MKISDLKKEMDAGFGRVDARLDGLKNDMDGRFQAVDARFAAVDARFDAVDARFDAVDARFDAVDARFDAMTRVFYERFEQTDQKIMAVEERTRRYMDILVESLRTDMQLYFEKAVATDQKLSDNIIANAMEHAAFINALVGHEARIKAIESK